MGSGLDFLHEAKPSRNNVIPMKALVYFNMNLRLRPEAFAGLSLLF